MDNKVITEVPGGILSTIKQWWREDVNAIETCYFSDDSGESEIIGVTVVTEQITESVLRTVQAKHLENSLIRNR